MASYADFLGRYNGRLGGLGGGGSNPLVTFYNALNGLYNNSHGSARYTLANLPFFGRIRNYIDQAHKAQDQYDNTGTDSPYIDRYQHGGTPFLSDLSAGIARPVKMAKTLAKMYGADVELDILRERKELARAVQTSAVLWRDAWAERNRK